jgi:hypothetical protein
VPHGGELGLARCVSDGEGGTVLSITHCSDCNASAAPATCTPD